MVLPDWNDLPAVTRRSPRKIYELIKNEVNGTTTTVNTETYDISVAVSDGTNAISGVSVILTKGNKTYRGTTGSKGGCNINNVLSGDYTISATKTGLTPFTGTLTVSHNQTLDIVMEQEEDEED